MGDDPTKSYSQDRPVRVAGSDDASGADDSLTLTWGSPRGDQGAGRTIPRTLGPVRLIEEIGRGGMGVVYRGWDEVLRRAVAVKLLLGAVPSEEDPHFEQFLAGARAEAALRHPNIVAVHTAGSVDGLPYLVMDHIDGPTLRAVWQPFKETGDAPCAAAIKVICDIASAVAALHERGVVHRDLKPSNVLFDRDGQLFVTDFGLAALGAGADRPLSTAGTPTYMSPDAFAGRASPQTDVYALGIILFELLAGQPPFRGDPNTLTQQHAAVPLPQSDLADRVPPEVMEIVERAAHKNDIFRYKSADHFHRALRSGIATNEVLRDGEPLLRALVTRTIAGETEDQPTPSVPTTPPSSYFDRLAQIAADKRGDSGALRNDQSADPDSGADSGALRRIDDDLPCVGCGYNLRGQTRGSLCPECATPIRRSMTGDLLTGADVEWLQRVCRGQSAINTACLSGLLLLLLVVGLVFVAAADLVSASLEARLLQVLGWLPLVPAVLLLVGTLGVTALDPRLTLTEQPLALRRLVRWAAVLTVAAVPLMQGIWLILRGVGASTAALHAVHVVMNPVFAVIALGTLISACSYLAGLAARIPDANLAGRIKSAGRGFAICVLLMLVCDAINSRSTATGAQSALTTFIAIFSFIVFVVVTVYAVSLMRLMLACGRSFRRCLHEAHLRGSDEPT
ncbi:MAG: serine/threonine protein kinase [bacterium]|nr:serine/threonine protein kinase [bacterium]